jgi:hypothetical protein
MNEIPIPEPIRASLRKLTMAEGTELMAWFRETVDRVELTAREDERARTLATIAVVRGLAEGNRPAVETSRLAAESRGLRATVGTARR